MNELKKIFSNAVLKYSLIAVAASLAFGVFTNVLPEKISQKDPVYGYGSDGQVYWDLGGNLAKGLGFVNSPGFAFSYIYPVNYYTYGTQRLPGYPLLLAAVRALNKSAGPNGASVAVLNLILVFLNAYFIIGLLRKFLPGVSNKWYLSVALFPPFLLYSNGINSDFFLAVLLAGFCYFLAQEGKKTWLALPFAAFAFFTRANALFFIVPFLILLTVFNRKNRKILWLSGCTIFAVALIFLGWSWRNQKLSGSFNFAPYTGSQLEQNYIRKIYRNSRPSGQERFYRWNMPDFVLARFTQLAKTGGIYSAEAEMNKEMINDTISLLWQQKFLAVKVYIRDVAQILTNEYFIFNMARAFNNLYIWAAVWIAVILLYSLPGALMLFLAAVFAFSRKTSFPAILLYSAALYTLGTAAVLGDFSRYIEPVGFAIIYSVIFVFTLKDKSSIIK